MYTVQWVVGWLVGWLAGKELAGGPLFEGKIIPPPPPPPHSNSIHFHFSVKEMERVLANYTEIEKERNYFQ
jgi:hypothetical protein